MSFFEVSHLLKNSMGDGPGEQIGRELNCCPIQQKLSLAHWEASIYQVLLLVTMFTFFFCWRRSTSTERLTSNWLPYNITLICSSCKHTVSAWVLLRHCLHQNSAVSRPAQGCSTRTQGSEWFCRSVLQSWVSCLTSAELVPLPGTHAASSRC